MTLNKQLEKEKQLLVKRIAKLKSEIKKTIIKVNLKKIGQ